MEVDKSGRRRKERGKDDRLRGRGRDAMRSPSVSLSRSRSRSESRSRKRNRAPSRSPGRAPLPPRDTSSAPAPPRPMQPPLPRESFRDDPPSWRDSNRERGMMTTYPSESAHRTSYPQRERTQERGRQRERGREEWAAVNAGRWQLGRKHVRDNAAANPCRNLWRLAGRDVGLDGSAAAVELLGWAAQNRWIRCKTRGNPHCENNECIVCCHNRGLRCPHQVLDEIKRKRRRR
ncbi:uncharacterized protein EV422DRAFT_205821 [Fimicolochytrium jonesii]|uniref:uncharacterized protein n=1 Tax=Fimicolochytrium jonesii TaxID=1396493 RepID=UPI0022FE0911|nr:uncharacterized protein EV422DRAFT_205821 [Fimicolochytrium jonesii]KAI8817788.1 hypothetical protein EV422DRAFT_205821 [Fimicolochytrium jonesii]